MSRLLRPGLFGLLLPALPASAQGLNIASELLHGGMGIVAIGALSVLALAVPQVQGGIKSIAKV